MKNSNSFCLIFIYVITQKSKSALYMIMLKDILTHQDGSHLTSEGSILLLEPFNDFIKKLLSKYL